MKILFLKKIRKIWFWIDFPYFKIFKVFVDILKNLFKPFFFYPLLILGIISSISLFIILQKYNFLTLRPDIILKEINTFTFIIIWLLLILGGILHEFGHIAALKYYGYDSEGIGIGFYLGWFIIYAKVDNIWYLKKEQRVIVNFGGVYFQLIINIFLFILYFMTINDKNYNYLFLYLSLINGISIIFLLIPFYRWDGYWIISDWMGIQNLFKELQNFFLYYLKKFKNQKMFYPTILKLPRYKKIILFILYISFPFITLYIYKNLFDFYINIVSKLHLYFNKPKERSFGEWLQIPIFIFGIVALITYIIKLIKKNLFYKIKLKKI